MTLYGTVKFWKNLLTLLESAVGKHRVKIDISLIVAWHIKNFPRWYSKPVGTGEHEKERLESVDCGGSKQGFWARISSDKPAFFL